MSDRKMMLWFVQRIGDLDMTLFPVSSDNKQTLLAAIQNTWIPSTKPLSLDFLRAVFQMLNCDKKVFLQVVKRLLPQTVPILDFFREIEFVLPHNMVESAIYFALKNRDIECAQRLGLVDASQIVLHRALENAIAMQDVTIAEKMLQIAGSDVDVVRESFDRTAVIKSLTLLFGGFGPKTISTVQWLLDNRFIGRENLNWGTVIDTARSGHIDLLSSLLDQFFKETSPKIIGEILLRIAFEKCNYPLLDFLKTRKIICEEMVAKIGLPLLAALGTRCFDPGSSQENTSKEEIRWTKKWVDENYPGLLKP